MNFTSLDDAFPNKPWPKKHPLTSKHVPEQRDSEKESRTFPTPQHRGQHAMQKHKKTIDDLTSSLPIGDVSEGNFFPEKISPSTREHFSGSSGIGPGPQGDTFAYAPPQFQLSAHELRIQKLVEMFDQVQGEDTPGTQDMLLYIFTGVFFLYTFEILSNLKRSG